MNQLGVHAMLWLREGSRASWQDAVTGAATAGFDALEIPLRDPAAVQPRSLEPMLRQAGLTAVCMVGLPPDRDLASGDPEQARRGEAFLAECVRLARDLGSAYLGGVIYGSAGRHDAPPPADWARPVADVLARVADLAASAGIVLGVEAVNRFESNAVNTAAAAVALLDLVGHPALRVHLDTFHMNLEETDPALAVRTCAARLGYLQISESTRGVLGEGTADLDGVLAAAMRARYTGPIGFESFRGSTAPPALRASMALWRDFWTDPTAAATAARAYLAARINGREPS